MFARFLLGLTLCSLLALATGLPVSAQGTPPATTALPVEGGAYTISLLPTGQAILTAIAPTADVAPATWGGAWSQAEGDVYVRLNATGSGVALKKAVQLEGVIANGAFDVQGLGADNLVYDREDLDLTLGSGQRHPFVRTINQLATAIPYLNYTYPATDDNVYTENLRRTVARFQEVEGLTPTGLIDLPTLLALVTPAPARLDTSKVTFTVGGDVVNVRGGPGTDYPVTQRIYAGDVLDVVGKVDDGAPRGAWLQICCLAQQNGWVRADLGAVTGDLNLIDTVPADQLPPAPAPAPAQPTAGRGQPLLANLPTTTPEGAPVVYLTFDDGPNGAFTQQVLDLLAQYDARATFFVIGRQAAGGADVLRRTASEGSYIGNHTWDHVWLDKISKEEFIDQIQRTRNELLAVAGDLFTLDGDVLYVRPPYGAINTDDRQWMAELGYTPVLWDVDPQDWRRPGVETIANHVVSHAFPGAIILMHDGGGERAQSVAALEIILRELSAQGYRFYNIFGQ